MSTIRDRLWLWGHEAGSHNEEWNLPAASQIMPAQAAENMGIPNIIMVRYRQEFDAPYYAASLRGMERVVWSIVGAGGLNEGIEMAPLRQMAMNYPNWRGVMMDDFFFSTGHDATAVHTADDLKAIQNQLSVNGRKLDLWVVLYDHQLKMPVQNHLAQCDVLNYWTWRARDLDKLEANFARAEALAPACRKVLGCYMWDYGDKKPLPAELMRQQCELGLQWLRAGRIEGIVFLASCICDLDIEAVNWTSEWIRQVGDEPLSSG
ncbi:MAG TPA: hypothetical protein VNA16_00235 [Abditibacteriaceae bacterium]|nr:hypothetical protein [Abditibacteriaceae bacterium]